MATIIYDTHKIVTKLAERGFTEDQAVAITEVLQELDLSDLATKSDVKDLKYELTRNFFALLLAQGALVVAALQFLLG